MATTGTITPSVNDGTTTLTDLETAVTANVNAATTIQGSTMAAPAPVNVEVTIAPKAVAAMSISMPNIPAAAAVGYTPVSTADAVTNESLNQTAETLKADVNAKLTAWAESINTALSGVSNSDLASATDVSNKLAQIGTEITALMTGVNAALEVVRQKNIAQNDSIALAINTVAGDMLTNDSNLKAALDTIDAKIRGLDDVYGTDADFSARMLQVNDFIETLRGTDIGFVQAVDTTIDEVNSLTRVASKVVTMNSASGVFPFVNAANGLPLFAAATDYDIQAQIVGNGQVQVHVANKTETGFNLVCRSNGVHFVPQPHDGSVTPVQVLVRTTFAKQTPMSATVDTLKASWIADGSGTQSNTVGA